MKDQPSIDPNNLGNMLGFSDTLQRKTIQQINCMLPCKVTSHDRTKNIVTVQPQIKYITADGDLSRAPVYDIPVMRFGDSQFQISFQIPVNSFGWIHVLDRGIATFLETLKEEVPDNLLFLDFTNSVFIPDSIQNFPVDSTDGSAMTIHNKDNTTKISLSSNNITIKASNITIDGNLAVSGTMMNNGQNVGNTHTHSYIPGTRPPARTGGTG